MAQEMEKQQFADDRIIDPKQVQTRRVLRDHPAQFFRDIWGFPGASDGKASACNAGDQGSIPGLGILSAAMMLRYTFDMDKEADAIEAAVKQVLKEGYRTIDIMPQAGKSTDGITQVGTKEMGDLIAARV